MNNINYAQGGYAHEEVFQMLIKNREVKYELYALSASSSHDFKYELTNFVSGSIDFDSTREIMRTCSFEVVYDSSMIEIEEQIVQTITSGWRIVPMFCIHAPNGSWLRYPLGMFIVDLSRSYPVGAMHWHFTGYDLGLIAQDAKLENVLTYSQNTVYTSAVSNRIGTLYDRYDVIQNANLKSPAALEYEIGHSELEVINDMLHAINYSPLYFDEYGTATAEPYIFPEEREVQENLGNNIRITFPGDIRRDNRLQVPNRFVRYTNDPDHGMLRSVYTVEDYNIPTSVDSVGRVITDVQEVKDVASQDELDNLTRRAAVESSQITQTVEFETINMPGHGYRNCLYYENKKYIETAWSMDLTPGGKMKHTAQKVVTLL